MWDQNVCDITFVWTKAVFNDTSFCLRKYVGPVIKIWLWCTGDILKRTTITYI